MRPRGVTRAEMPDTMAWGHSGQCKSCVQPNGPTDRGRKTERPTKPAVTAESTPPRADGSKDVHLEHTIAGLSSFMAERERRLRIQTSRAAAAQQPLRRIA
jgi:hypothetical protein